MTVVTSMMIMIFGRGGKDDENRCNDDENGHKDDNAEGSLSIITVAPEVLDLEQIKMLKDAGIIVSAGHTFGTYEEAMKGFDNGVTMVTHLFNAMSQFSSREPGVVGGRLCEQSTRINIALYTSKVGVS